MLKSGPMFGLICSQIAHDWAWFLIIADLPKYMKNVLNFSIVEVSEAKDYHFYIMFQLYINVCLKRNIQMYFNL